MAHTKIQVQLRRMPKSGKMDITRMATEALSPGQDMSDLALIRAMACQGPCPLKDIGRYTQNHLN